MYDPHDFGPLPAAHLIAPRGTRQWSALCSAAVSFLLTLILFAAGLPSVALCLLAISGISTFVLGSPIAMAAPHAPIRCSRSATCGALGSRPFTQRSTR